MKRTAHAVAAALVVMAMAGCDGGGGTTPPDATPSSSAAARTADTPFAGIYAAFGGPGEEQAAAAARTVQDLVAACMADQGFSYVPVDQSAVAELSVSESRGIVWGTREFAETYGYGASTDPWLVRDESANDPADPNTGYTAGMSEAERAAYDDALYGDPEDGEDRSDGGCYGSAQREVYGGASAWDDPDFQAFTAEMTSVAQQVDRDPRVLDATADWSACMADAGYPGLAEADDAEVAAFETAGAVYDALDPERYTADELDAEAQRRRAELTDGEIATAVADFDCKAEVGYQDIRLAVQIELEQAFVDANADELAAFAAAYGVATD